MLLHAQSSLLRLRAFVVQFFPFLYLSLHLTIVAKRFPSAVEGTKVVDLFNSTIEHACMHAVCLICTYIELEIKKRQVEHSFTLLVHS